MSTSIVDAASELLERGLPIIPCNDKCPCDDRGAPLDKWHQVPISMERVEAGLRGSEHPAIGLIFGPQSGIIDIEADSDEEEALFAKLFAGAEIPVCPTYQSTRGKHRLFAWDSRLEETGLAVASYRNGSAAKLGIRLGAGGKSAQSVIPPSPGREWLVTFDDADPPPLPEVVLERIIACAKPKLAPRATGPTPSGAHRKALLAMRTSTKDMADGQDGSKRLYTCCCRAVELNLDDAAAVATMRAYEAGKPFPRSYTDAEIVARIRDAEKQVERGAEVCIANCREVEVEKKNADGETETTTIIEPTPLGDIIAEINNETDNWPRRVDNVLFVHDEEHGVGWFDRHGNERLFGWLRRKFKVDWRAGPKLVTQGNLFAELERTATSYDAIELLPHEPPIERFYYACNEINAGGDGKHFRWLLNRFRPSTTIDADLIQAAIMTAFWGGRPGCRPAFVITSDAGRGAGKTKLAEIIACLAGGFIDVSAGEEIGVLKQRFLSPEGMTRRVAMLDNVKTMKLSWDELEKLITTQTISGKRMYVGEGQRPNVVTWLITLNGVSLATDMAQRSVIIKIDKGDNAGPWYEETMQYIDRHREEIIGDVIAALRADPAPLANYSRWAAWEQAVLSRLPEPGEAQAVILERQGAANCETDEAEIVEEYFAQELWRLKYNPRTCQVRIPVAVAAQWYCRASNERIKTAAVSRRINQLASEGQLKQLTPDTSRTYGRGFVWTGQSADVMNEPIVNDLRERLAEYHADA